MTGPIIPDDAKFVTATQAINSPRWPFRRDTFYKMVKRNQITPILPYEGARPVYSVAEIDAIYMIAAE